MERKWNKLSFHGRVTFVLALELSLSLECREKKHSPCLVARNLSFATVDAFRVTWPDVGLEYFTKKNRRFLIEFHFQVPLVPKGYQVQIFHFDTTLPFQRKSTSLSFEWFRTNSLHTNRGKMKFGNGLFDCWGLEKVATDWTEETTACKFMSYLILSSTEKKCSQLSQKNSAWKHAG